MAKGLQKKRKKWDSEGESRKKRKERFGERGKEMWEGGRQGRWKDKNAP